MNEETKERDNGEYCYQCSGSGIGMLGMFGPIEISICRDCNGQGVVFSKEPE